MIYRFYVNKVKKIQNLALPISIDNLYGIIYAVSLTSKNVWLKIFIVTEDQHGPMKKDTNGKPSYKEELDQKFPPAQTIEIEGNKMHHRVQNWTIFLHYKSYLSQGSFSEHDIEYLVTHHINCNIG